MTSMLGRGVDTPCVVSVQRTAEHSFLDGETEMENKIKPVHERLHGLCPPQLTEDFNVTDVALRVFKSAMGDHILDGAYGLWFSPDGGDGHSPDGLAFDIGSRLKQLCDMYNGNCFQSPIEEQLAVALLWVKLDWAGFVDHSDYFENWVGDKERMCAGAYLTPQASVGSYKVDLMLWITCGNQRSGIAIECDGHAFHEKTKEQAASDKRRDRDLLAAGFPVMRFTGSEIFKDPLACAEQVREVASETLFRVSKAAGLF